MTTRKELKSQFNQHADRFGQLELFLEKVDYALLGEETEMRGELYKVRQKVVQEMRQERRTMEDIVAQAKAVV